MLRTVTPTLSATIGVNCPGHIGIGLSMVPKDPNWIGIQIAPRVSMVASTLCWVAPGEEGRVHRADAGGVVGEPRRTVAPRDRLRGHTRAEEAYPQGERGEPRAGLVRQSLQRSVPPSSLRGRGDCRAALSSLSTG